MSMSAYLIFVKEKNTIQHSYSVQLYVSVFDVFDVKLQWVNIIDVPYACYMLDLTSDMTVIQLLPVSSVENKSFCLLRES